MIHLQLSDEHGHIHLSLLLLLYQKYLY